MATSIINIKRNNKYKEIFFINFSFKFYFPYDIFYQNIYYIICKSSIIKKYL